MSSRRTVLPVLLAVGLVLAACGGGGTEPSALTSAVPADDLATGDDATGDASTSAAPSDDLATDAGAGTSAGPSDDVATGATRTVTHAMGDTEVPAAPDRVVVLDSPHLDTALALGVTPVGTTVSEVDDGPPPYLGGRADDVAEVGLIDEPDLETVASLQPDLIIGAKVRHEAIYDQLSAIAPTVFSESSGTNWTDGFAVAADALGLADEGASALAAFEQRAAEVGDAVGADDLTVSIVRFLPGENRLYGPDTFSGTVLREAGFTIADQDWNEFSMVEFASEQVELIDADVVFAATYGEADQTFRSEVETLWASLDAVRDGRQFDVDDREWMVGIGLIGGELILDDLETLLGDG